MGVPRGEGFAGCREGDVNHLTGRQVNRSCRTQLGPVGEMDLDPDPAEGGSGGVFYCAKESIGIRVEGENQPSAGPNLVEGLAQGELGTGFFITLIRLRTTAVLTRFRTTAVLTRLRTTAIATRECEYRDDADQHKDCRETAQRILLFSISDRRRGNVSASKTHMKLATQPAGTVFDTRWRTDRRTPAVPHGFPARPGGPGRSPQ